MPEWFNEHLDSLVSEDVILIIFSSPIAAILVGGVMCWQLCGNEKHRNDQGSLSIPRIQSVFVASAATYTFLVTAAVQFLFPSIGLHRVIENFGDERFAYLLTIVVLDGGLRLWKIFDEANPVR